MLDSASGLYVEPPASSRPGPGRWHTWGSIRPLLVPLFLLMLACAFAAVSVQVMPAPEPDSPSFVFAGP